MDKPKKYKIVLSKDALQDIKSTKTYILQTFMYREYAENFSKKIKSAIKGLIVTSNYFVAENGVTRRSRRFSVCAPSGARF